MRSVVVPRRFEGKTLWRAAATTCRCEGVVGQFGAGVLDGA